MRQLCDLTGGGRFLAHSCCALAFLLFGLTVASGQGNSISGHVFGTDRKPLSDINMELRDEFSRTISRGRTNSAGRYFFMGLSAGRFIVKAMPMGTNYEEEEQEVEIVNFVRQGGIGGDQTRISGHANEQRDFYLRRRFVPTGLTAPATVFAQEIPDHAKQLYKTGLEHLEHKRTQEGYDSIKAAIEVFPQYFAALETLGVEYVKAGHFEAAEILLSVALQVNPRSYKSWYGLAKAYAGRKKYGESLGAAEKAIEQNGAAVDALFLAGTLLRQAKEYEKAEKYLLKAQQLAGDVMPDIYWELALLYGNGMKRYKDAAKELRLYLKALPDDKDAVTVEKVEKVKKLIVEFEEKAKSAA
jgi:tetratricopeptide (TPR) repeat protein